MGSAAVACLGLLALLLAADSGAAESSRPVTLFLAGDVMTGRGIDQILPHSSSPELHERSARSARVYVDLAAQANGSFPRLVPFPYIWGDALVELEARAPDARLINLETTITRSNAYWKRKTIHYRMHPDNIPALAVAGIDHCSLANNHALDWGRAGLVETLETLESAGIAFSGAGRSRAEAERPAGIQLDDGVRVVVFSYGHRNSGIPADWAASEEQPGVNLLPDLSDRTVRQIADQVRAVERPGDVIVASLHWGENWGYEIAPEARTFAQRLVEQAGVDVVYGHSSHHVKGIEVHRDKLILYGVGDLLNDYEGIGRGREFRGDLVLMYFARIDPATGKLLALDLVPLRMRRLRLERASAKDASWIRGLLTREGRPLGTRAEENEDGTLRLRWQGVAAPSAEGRRP